MENEPVLHVMNDPLRPISDQPAGVRPTKWVCIKYFEVAIRSIGLIVWIVGMNSYLLYAMYQMVNGVSIVTEMDYAKPTIVYSAFKSRLRRIPWQNHGQSGMRLLLEIYCQDQINGVGLNVKHAITHLMQYFTVYLEEQHVRIAQIKLYATVKIVLYVSKNHVLVMICINHGLLKIRCYHVKSFYNLIKK